MNDGVNRPPHPAALSPRLAVAAALAYCAAHAAISLGGGPSLALDEVKLNVLTQSLEPGYLPDNPPLFEWTLIGAQAVLGPTLASFVAVKYAFLLIAAGFTFLAVGEAAGDHRAAAAAALMLPLLPPVGWAYHQTLTHSAALIAAIAFFWYALLRIGRRNDIPAFALLGLAFGLGALSKYAFIPAAMVAIAAALSQPGMRRALLRPGLGVTALVAVLIAAPHLVWIMGNRDRAGAAFNERLIGGGDHLARVAEGLPAALWAVAAFAGPMLVMILAADRMMLRRLAGEARSVPALATAASICAVVAAVIALGLANFHERYAIAFLFPAFIWLTVAAAKSPRREAVFSLLLAASAASSVAAAAARGVAVLRPGAPFCEECRQHIPYTHLRAALGAVGRGETLVAFDDATAGNLRQLFPQARVISSHLPFYTPPPPADGRCRFLWSTDIAPPPPESVRRQFDEKDLARAGGPWARAMNGEEKPRETWWTIAEVDPASAFGADLCRL